MFFFVIWTTLALIQLAQTDNIQNTNNLPLSFICDDDQIREMALELKLVKLMNENMQLKINDFNLSIKQQHEELKNLIEMMNQKIQSKLEAFDISINKQFEELRKVDTNKHEHKLCDYNATLSNLSTSFSAIGLLNTTLSANINANSTTSGDCTTASSDVIPKYCQSGRSGIQSIHVPNVKLSPLLVNCIQDSEKGEEPWILIQRRRDGSVDFYRNWSDYQQGFGNLEGEFFIGLDKLHALTQSALYELWIQMEDFSNITGWARYSRFSIGDEGQLYVLNSLGNFTGNVGDSLSKHVENKFTTKDKDNDNGINGNCAIDHHGAWWYHKCYWSNLNGKYFHVEMPKEDPRTGITWVGWLGYKHLLKYVHMAIRPVNKLS